MRPALAVVGVLSALFGVVMIPHGELNAESAGETHSFVVVYADGASNASGRVAIQAAGGVVTGENEAVGLAEVTSTNPNFLQDVRGQSAIKGAARDRSIGTARPGMGHRFSDEGLEAARLQSRPHSGGPAVKPAPGTESLSGYQWDMRMINVQDETATTYSTSAAPAYSLV